MKNRHLLPFLIAAAAAAGCDDGESTPKPDPDMLADVGPSIDMDEADMLRDMDVVDPDMAINLDMDVTPDMTPDMDVMPDQMVDQEVDQMIDASTLVERGPACVEDNECGGDFERCVDDLCSIDLRPETFVVSDIRIVEPARSAELISTFLNPAVDDHQLNLIIEPGGYNDMGEFLWYIGNGGYNRGRMDYDYLRPDPPAPPYPIQNFYGFWRDVPGEGLVWAPEDEVLFSLNVPAGQVEDENGGPPINCLAELVTTVELKIYPSVGDGGLPTLRVELIGVLTLEDAERVEVPIAGNRFPLTDLLNPEDLNIDMDGDGEFDAYPFHFDVDASSVVFTGEPPLPDGSNRDPDPVFMNPAACNE